MLSFLFEQYGYYPSNLSNNAFFIDNWEFRLINVECSEEYCQKIDDYASLIRREINENYGPYIIKTRFNKLVSFHDNRKYVLVCVKRGNVSFNEFNKLHVLFKSGEKYVDLKNLLLTWNDRINSVEKEAAGSLRVDSFNYGSNIEKTMFCLGMCQNAVQYLSEIIQDYGSTIENVTITHKRLEDFSNFNFYNPFNLILDHPLRDLTELYKSDFFDAESLLEALKYYEFDAKLASVFIARMLYPLKFLDELENNMLKKDKDFKVEYSMEKELIKIKRVYLYFKEKYNIRPINWLD